MKSQNKTSESDTLLRQYLSKKHPVTYGIMAFILIIFVIIPLAQTIVLRLQVSYGSRTALNSRKDTLSATHNEKLAQRKLSMQIMGNSVYSVTYDTCYVGHSDGGWMVNSYNYACQLSYVEFFDIPPIALSFVNSIGLASETSIGTQDTGFVAGSNDIDDYLSAISQEHSSSYETYSVSLLGNNDAQKVIANSFLLNTPIDTKKHKLIYEAGNPKLDTTKRYIVLSDSDQYYFNDVGCAYGRIPFCSSPI